VGPTTAVAAVDLGATSGRVILGHVGRDELRMQTVARFANGPVERADGLHWDASALFEHALGGLADALTIAPDVRSVGVDSWAVDYGLLAGGRLLDEPFHYRDARTARGVAAVHARVAPDELYRRTGLQFLPFTTLYQFAADTRLAEADSALLIADLFGYWLTGAAVAERTNASTTGLLSVATGRWDDELLERLGIPRTLLPELVDPGTPLGALTPAVASRIGAPSGLSVTAVGSHDTASAVVAVPAVGDDFAYISCGTWGLVGVELERPVLSEESRAANFTNEGGVDGRIRFLHNVMGLWLLSESVRTWEAAGNAIDLPELIARAAELPPGGPVFDANDPRFLAPGDIPARIARWCAENDVAVPEGHLAMTRCIIESLAVAFADAVHTAARLSGRPVSVIHLVGGGALNVLLCQLTADRAGLPVVAGPVEATAVGNVLVQARALGAASGSLEALRSLVARAFAPTVYRPRA
jgi:rhamnulokinase